MSDGGTRLLAHREVALGLVRCPLELDLLRDLLLLVRVVLAREELRHLHTTHEHEHTHTQNHCPVSIHFF